MNKKWPKLHCSWKISWIELSLSDWTGFVCLGNFHSWALLVVYFNRPNRTLSSLPRRNTAFPKPSADAWNVLRSLCPELPVPMVFPNKLIFLTILGLPQFTFFFPFFFFRSTSAISLKPTKNRGKSNPLLHPFHPNPNSHQQLLHFNSFMSLYF